MDELSRLQITKSTPLRLHEPAITAFTSSNRIRLYASIVSQAERRLD
jgi:hypothetical protein